MVNHYRVAASDPGPVPFDASHDAVDSRADTQQSQVQRRIRLAVCLISCVLLQPDRHGRRQCRRPSIPQPGIGGKIAIDIQPQRLEHQFAMRGSDLVTERPIDIASLPGEFSQETSKIDRARFDSLVHQLFRIGGHQGPHVSAGFVSTALTQVMKNRVGMCRRSQQPISAVADIPMGQQHRTAGGTNSQRSHRIFYRPAIEGFIRIETFNGVLNQLPAIFRADDQRGLDLPQFNHACRLQHPVQYAQARVGHIVNHALCRQFERMMHATTGRWFQMVPAD